MKVGIKTFLKLFINKCSKSKGILLTRLFLIKGKKNI